MMQFCDAHWQTLRAAIEGEGVSHLIAKDGAAAARAMRRDVEGTSGPDDYDPLMAAHNMIVSKAMDELGAVNVLNGDCPLCMRDDAHKRGCHDSACDWSTASVWIPGAAHDAAEYARRHLVPRFNDEPHLRRAGVGPPVKGDSA